MLELRRRDDDRPVWVQWWSKPEPDDNLRRTMFIDITERMLAEQERNRLEQQNAYLVEEIKSVHNFEEIIGRSEALTRVLDEVRHGRADGCLGAHHRRNGVRQRIDRAGHSFVKLSREISRSSRSTARPCHRLG